MGVELQGKEKSVARKGIRKVKCAGNQRIV